MEKVIQEWRVVETDDGFRIEMKGNKEQMREHIQHLAFHRHFRWPRRWRRFSPWAPWSAGNSSDHEGSEEGAE